MLHRLNIMSFHKNIITIAAIQDRMLVKSTLLLMALNVIKLHTIRRYIRPRIYGLINLLTFIVCNDF